MNELKIVNSTHADAMANKSKWQEGMTINVTDKSLPIPADKVGTADSVDKDKVPVVQADGSYKLGNVPADQTYDATSTKPQSGVAVAQAIAQGGGGGGASIGGGHKLSVVPSSNWGEQDYDFAILGMVNGVYGFHHISTDVEPFSNIIKGTIDGVAFELSEGESLVVENASIFVVLSFTVHDYLWSFNMRQYDGSVVPSSPSSSEIASLRYKICYLTGDTELSSED